ncbi:MAG: hypothetical protein R3C56_34340 [Pirellulaceae bacterium]
MTCGNDVASIVQFLKSPEATSYAAADVVERLLNGIAPPNAIGSSLLSTSME